jgi:hypothetical protein
MPPGSIKRGELLGYCGISRPGAIQEQPFLVTKSDIVHTTTEGVMILKELLILLRKVFADADS